MPRHTLVSLGVLACFIILGIIWFLLLRNNLLPHFSLTKPTTDVPTAPTGFAYVWKGLPINVNGLTPLSMVRVVTNTDEHYELEIKPAAASSQSDISALSITVRITYLGDEEAFPDRCIVPTLKDDLSIDTFYIKHHKIEISHFVPTHSTGPYSNPNPYTPEVEALLKKFIGNIAIGKC